ncbi:MAG: AtpZ/AtpI family protein [Candidatus Atribacteria bacterium]|nr:AtpZ/AtpI family protein [Candidatus Atribacteria bacterium]
MRKKKTGIEENIWKNFGQIWDISWMTIAPIVMGVFLGQYLDKNYPLGFSWTLSLIALGALLGFYNLYQFLMRESEKDENDRRDDGNRKKRG